MFLSHPPKYLGGGGCTDKGKTVINILVYFMVGLYCYPMKKKVSVEWCLLGES